MTDQVRFPAETVVASAHDDGVVLFDLVSGRMFSVNHTGAHIWHRLERREPSTAIVDSLSREYRIAPEAAETCVCNFMCTLGAHNLIVSGE
jgi:hypothetical protein